MKIGIGITTHNREAVFLKTLSKILEHWQGQHRIVVVDDASMVPYAGKFVEQDLCPVDVYRFEQNVGIAAAKNKCFELLDDCDHIFLFDDDTYPVVADWWKPYVESKEPHLMYIFQDFIKPRLNDTHIVYQDSSIIAYDHPRGCMLYFHKQCLNRVGGMDTIFGKWGYEHGDLSNRIFNKGLTSFRYMDVPGSKELFYSSDEHETVETTVSGLHRLQQIKANKGISESRKYSTLYVPYKEKKDIVITTLFTGVKDPQRPQGFDIEQGVQGLSDLLLSCRMYSAELVVLHDGALSAYTHFGLNTVKVETSINPYFQRWISIMQYLRDNRDSLGKVFCVDATDVEMLKNPFPHMGDGVLYTGSEEEKVNCIWLKRHHQHEKIQRFISVRGNERLMNAGLLGGDVDTVIKFCADLIDLYADCLASKTGPGMTDMGLYNYALYGYYHGAFDFGNHINTRFKANERNSISWFKHK